MVLPPGIYPATFKEVSAAFATNAVRRELFDGLLLGAAALAYAGCRLIYLDGSYVTAKPMPGDYDACWEPAGVEREKLDAVFFDHSNKRAAQKAKFGGEYLPVVRDSEGHSFIDLFQREKFTGGTKGILSIPLTAIPYLQGGSQ